MKLLMDMAGCWLRPLATPSGKKGGCPAFIQTAP